MPNASAARIAAFRAALPADGRGASCARLAARALFKLMAYKDEYEVARLHCRHGLRRAAGGGRSRATSR